MPRVNPEGYFFAYFLIQEAIAMTEIYFYKEYILILRDGGEIFKFDKGSCQYDAFADAHDYLIAFFC